ncbi:MAG: hypothetical protein J6N51_10615 [Selenomonas sp.]|nr:hypothetical protein [Selenomonas sp.]MBP3731035.1 hypothetical protein [Mailhella sp.]
MMTNRQWLIWQLIDMSDEELVKKCPGFLCDICADYITPGSGPCIADCDKILIDWLNQEHKEG